MKFTTAHKFPRSAVTVVPVVGSVVGTVEIATAEPVPAPATTALSVAYRSFRVLLVCVFIVTHRRSECVRRRTPNLPGGERTCPRSVRRSSNHRRSVLHYLSGGRPERTHEVHPRRHTAIHTTPAATAHATRVLPPLAQPNLRQVNEDQLTVSRGFECMRKFNHRSGYSEDVAERNP